ncbi:hypothetical protein BKA70DRAFT_1257298 [Coprinopsis sp. MPI-PUGE-AT-0042]|nr:hypothetical protein BKA70DRAFT_1257298 [Coprinopsis sp. MPI-PUGE-AT-0042]
MDPLQHLDHGYSAPPPAYTEEEFDHKVSTAIEASQQISFEDEWEPYDPKAFEAAAEAYQSGTQNQGSKAGGGGSSSMPTPSQSGSSIQPLRIHKKNTPSTDSKADMKKQDYASTKSSQASYQEGSSSSAAPAGSSVPYIYNEGDGDDIAPPPFSELPPQAHQDPHTEFNPYQGFTPSTQEVPLPPAVNVGPLEPPQLSPLHELQSSFGGPAPQALAAPEPPSQQAYRQSMPTPQPSIQVPTAFEHRPRSAMASPVFAPSFPNPPAAQLHVPPGGPTLRFSPSVAYNRKAARQPFAMPKEEQKPQAFSAASFYNAAVSSHMTSRPSPSVGYVHSPRPQQSALQQAPGSWGSPARPESVFSMASSFSGHTQSDSASQYGGYNAVPSQAMPYDWRNNYQR